MLSDEEKKAIEYLKIEYEKLMKEDNIFFPLYKSDAKRLIDLIEKQSKEIEELKKYKEGYKLLSYSLDNYTSKDKIGEYKTVVACPVCYGRGFVPAGFYDSTGLTWVSTTTGNETCRSCGGKGYIKL